MRSVATRNELVGHGLLINSPPRWAIHPGSAETFLLAGGLAPENLGSLYLPHDSDAPVMQGPRHVFCEERQMSNIQVWVPTEEEIKDLPSGE